MYKPLGSRLPPSNVKLPLLVLQTAVRVPVLVAMREALLRTVTEPSMIHSLPEPSTRNTELVKNSAPRLLMVQPLRMRSGVAAATLVIWRVLVDPTGARTVKSLIVRLALGVDELMVTVFVTALVMKMPA